MKPYYEDDQVTLLLGDAKQEAVNLQPASIQTIITSPPYFGLRDYGTSNQIGAEETPRDFINNLVSVFQALRPALKEDGVLCVNLGDSYAKTQSNNGGYSKSSRLAGFTSANTKARIANESGVLYNGVPLSQASSAEQIRVSLAMGMALNPRLKVLMIKDGSLLDANSMAAIREQIADGDYQLWLERVGDADKGAVIIEDGEVHG